MTSMDRALMKAIEHVEEKVDSGTSSGSHTHVITDITNLQSKLDTMESKITAISQAGGSSSGTTSTTVIAHTHTIDNIINLQTELDAITALTKEVPYHSHEIGNIVNLTTKLENFESRIKAVESSSASTAYPVGSIYFTTNTNILTPRDEMANTLWVKVKSPLSNYTAWQRVENKYPMVQLLEMRFKLYYPVGAVKTIYGSENVTSYITLLQTTNNFASLTQLASISWSPTGLGVQNDKLCMGLFSDRSNETTSGMLTDASVYSSESAIGNLKIYFPVGAIIFFRDNSSCSKAWKYISTNINGTGYEDSTIDIQPKTIYSNNQISKSYNVLIRNS